MAWSSWIAIASHVDQSGRNFGLARRLPFRFCLIPVLRTQADQSPQSKRSQYQWPRVSIRVFFVISF